MANHCRRGRRGRKRKRDKVSRGRLWVGHGAKAGSRGERARREVEQRDEPEERTRGSHGI